MQRSSAFSYTFRALAFSTGSFWLQITALAAVLTGRKTAFAVTSKQQLSGSFLPLVIPHIVYFIATLVGLGVAVARDGVGASVVTNACWALLTCALLAPVIYAAAPQRRRSIELGNAAGTRPGLTVVKEEAA